MTDKLFSDRVKDTGVSSGSAPLYDAADLGGAGLIGWYKASSLTVDVGATVAQWNDDSGNSRHLLQATEANKPVIGSTLLNGHRTLSFDGVNDFMARTGGVGLFNVNSPTYVFVVGRFRNLTNRAMFDLNDGTGTNEGTSFFAETNLKVRRDGANDATSSGFTDTAGFHVFSTVSLDARRDLFIDGTLNGSNTVNQAMTTLPTQLTIGSLAQGAVYNGDVDIAEIIVVHHFSLTDRMREQIEGTLAHKYGLAGLLPAAHPFKSKPRPHIPRILDTEFVLVDSDDTQRSVRLEIPTSVPNSGVTQPLIILRRENIPDYTSLAAPITSNATANWGGRYIINATAGSIVITLPAAATTNQNLFIQLVRADNVIANTVTVVTSNSQEFFDSYIETAHAFTMQVGGTVNIRSLGTVPVVTNINGVLSWLRAWNLYDVSQDPVVHYNFRDNGSLTLNGSEVSAINNLGTGGAAYNLTQTTASKRPTIDQIVTTLHQYATFDGTDDLNTAAAQDSVQNGTIGSVVGMYTQPAQEATSLYGQAPATGGQLNFHGKWSDGNTYLDMPITTARISGNVGTAFAGDANVYTMAGIRNGAAINLYGRGNQTPSLTGASASGSSSGTARLFLGANASGTNNFVGRIYEWAYFRVALTADERDRAAAYMHWASGTQSLIHASNPYRNVPPTVVLTTY